MQHLFVPFEIALKLKDKGFKELCFAEYRQWDGSDPWLHIYGCVGAGTEYQRFTTECTAPLYQQVITWFKTQNPKVFLLENFDEYWDVWYARGTNSTAYTAAGGHFDLNGAIEEALKLI